MQEYKNLWVFVETDEGKAKSVGYELLTPGRALADKLGQKLVAVVIGKDVSDVAADCIAYGADQVIVVEGDEYRNYNTDAETYAMTELISKYRPSIVFYGATNNGRRMPPYVPAYSRNPRRTPPARVKFFTRTFIWTCPRRRSD